MENRNRVKEREKRIKQMNRKENDDFDFETETVINMTNKNNRKVESRNRIKNEKVQKRKQKKKKRIKMILRLTMLILLIIGSMAFAMISPIFNIKDIEVLNTNILSKETIISLSGLTINQNLFRFLKLDVEKSIKENPYVEDVKINRKLPNKIQIEVKERQRNFNLQFLNGYAYINNQGYILEISEDKQNMTILKGMETKEEDIVPGNRLCNNDLEKLESVIKIMTVAKENELDNKITSIDISNKSEYIIYLEEEQKTVYLGNDNNLNTKILYVKKIIEDEAGKEGKIFVNGDFSNKFRSYFRENV